MLLYPLSVRVGHLVLDTGKALLELTMELIIVNCFVYASVRVGHLVLDTGRALLELTMELIIVNCFVYASVRVDHLVLDTGKALLELTVDVSRTSANKNPKPHQQIPQELRHAPSDLHFLVLQSQNLEIELQVVRYLHPKYNSIIPPE